MADNGVTHEIIQRSPGHDLTIQWDKDYRVIAAYCSCGWDGVASGWVQTYDPTPAPIPSHST